MTHRLPGRPTAQAFFTRSTLSIALAAVTALSGTLTAQATATEASSDAAATEKVKAELDLEKIFPEKGFFGPSARDAEFTADGRFAAWLYRGYDERRHGNDLWVHDFDTGETTRVTSAVVMAAFQADARKVLDDRLEKAQKKAKDDKSKDADSKEKGGDDKGGKSTTDASVVTDATGTTDATADATTDKATKKKAAKRAKRLEQLEMMNTVDDEDADDEKAPRYHGISSFTWAPDTASLLFSSDGDIYRWSVGDKAPTRLTRTGDSERGVAWLPDGTGYTYMRDGALLRVRFGSHLVEQLDPTFGSGERLSSYQLSPDGKRAVFLTTKGQGRMEGGRTVKIASYRDRFVKVREVPRHVSDDPKPKATTKLYLYDLEKGLREQGLLYEIHSHEFTGPRDTLRRPEWSPDSSRVTFSWFEQESEHVTVLESVFPTEDEQDEAEEKVAEKEAAAVAAAEGEGEGEDGETKGGGSGGKGEKREEEHEQDPELPDPKVLTETKRVSPLPAKVVYRFLHNGGPNTPGMIAPKYLADSRSIVFISEQSGFRHLHVLDPLYESTRQLTHGRFEVYPIDLNEARTQYWVLATKEHSSQQDVYAVDVQTGAMQRLTTESGFYSSAAVSEDSKRVLAQFVDAGHPRELVAVDVAAGTQVALTDSHPPEAHAYTEAVPEFFSYENRHGHSIHGFLFKPDDWTPKDQRPAIIYVYGGPLGTRKQVTRGNFGSDGYLFAWYMAKKHGYVCATIDPRGMSGYGGVFEKANFEQVGKPQVEDLVDGVKHLAEAHGVAQDKVGLHGWSFGGFQTQMCLYTEPDVFACGIAGAGPTEWENYNSWYSTGTIGKSRQGTKEPDLKKFSLLPLAKNLKSRLLLVHGMEDSNVLYQDTVRVYRELLKAGKETLVELFLDPTGGHGLGGDVKRVNRSRKYEEFFVRNLGTGESATIEAETVEEAQIGEPVEAAATSSEADLVDATAGAQNRTVESGTNSK